MRRRVVEYGIRLIGFGKISNDELENLIWDHRNIHGLAWGGLMILGHFSLTGIKLQQKRVMESLVPIDCNCCHMR